MIRLLLAEDHTLVSDALGLFISVQTDMTLVGQCSDGADVLIQVRKHQPDVLLLDLGLPNLDGIAIMEALAQEKLSVRVLIVTARLDAASVRASLSLGATGYLLKTDNSEILLSTIRQVAAGKPYISAEVAGLIKDGMGSDTKSGASLTPREREILTLVGAGMSSKEIARRIGISDLTVRKHRENLCGKLGARNAAELIAIALRLH